jgi:hypothetical protein
MVENEVASSRSPITISLHQYIITTNSQLKIAHCMYNFENQKFDIALFKRQCQGFKLDIKFIT